MPAAQFPTEIKTGRSRGHAIRISEIQELLMGRGEGVNNASRNAVSKVADKALASFVIIQSMLNKSSRRAPPPAPSPLADGGGCELGPVWTKHVIALTLGDGRMPFLEASIGPKPAAVPSRLQTVPIPPK